MNRQEIATILARIRMAAGLTQSQIGDRLKKKQQTIASWESGQSQPDIEVLFELCKICGTTVNDAFGFSEFAITESEKEYIVMYRTLDGKGKARINSALKLEYDQRREVFDEHTEQNDVKMRA